MQLSGNGDAKTAEGQHQFPGYSLFCDAGDVWDVGTVRRLRRNPHAPVESLGAPSDIPLRQYEELGKILKSVRTFLEIARPAVAMVPAIGSSLQSGLSILQTLIGLVG